METQEAMTYMRGQPGTRVVIGIDRPGVPNVLRFDIIREIIRIRSVPYAFMLDDGIGYIRIRQFSNNTTNELREALDNLENQGMTGLLVDLRFNPGGLLHEAVTMVNEFIGPGRLVVSQKGRRDTSQDYITRFNRQRADYPVVVLINEASASASEIFAGSMQDWDRGIVVGKTSFGKGTVQSVVPLSEGYGMRVTIARYYLMSGRSIHKDENDRLLRGERVSAEEIQEIRRQNQEHIYHTMKGRQVFGGGGIVPDIEIDQSTTTLFERELRRLNLFFDFSIDYYNRHNANIELDFQVTPAIINEFIAFGASKGLEYTEEDIEESSQFIELTLRRELIHRKFGETEGYKAQIPLDTQLMEAINLFQRFSNLEEMFRYAETRR
jgi:carboxyl-terminal processing protease